MPKLATALKEEMVRLARKEIRGNTGTLRSQVTRHRADIASLKREVKDLRDLVGSLRKAIGRLSSRPAAQAEDKVIRFSAKGFERLRARLGVSASALGRLLGVSQQTVYNWEQGKTRPSEDDLPRVAALRTMGKRAIQEALEAL